MRTYIFMFRRRDGAPFSFLEIPTIKLGYFVVNYWSRRLVTKVIPSYTYIDDKSPALGGYRNRGYNLQKAIISSCHHIQLQ